MSAALRRFAGWGQTGPGIPTEPFVALLTALAHVTTRRAARERTC